jgi:hypothetical protein
MTVGSGSFAKKPGSVESGMFIGKSGAFIAYGIRAL